MKKLSKLSRDTSPQDQPEGSYPFGKNGIQDFIKGSVINEPGFLPSSTQIPYVPMGVIESDKYPVIFSTDNTNSAIGFYDDDNDIYTPILNDATMPFKLGFSTDRFITGQVQRNYKSQLVCAFTDKFLPPFYLNLDDPQADKLQDILLFPVANPPMVSVEVTTGGTLLPGAYYAAIKYVKNDGTETGYMTVSAPKIVTGTQGSATDQALEITIENVDTNYERLQIAVISKVNGVVSAVQLINTISVAGKGIVLFTGAELSESITLEEILVPPAIYDKVGTMGQLNDALYTTDLHSAPLVNMQKYANLIRLKWKSKLIQVDPVYDKMKNGEEKSFLHREVYAFYIRYKLISGKTTPAFHIPGRILEPTERDMSTESVNEGISSPRFRVEDTIGGWFYPATKSGYMGKWENETEVYPDTDDFNSSDVGGEDLRQQPVRHHRFPSISFCKQVLYGGDVDYGRSKLDMLGVSAENIIIPDKYADQIVGWELLYGKRTIGNSTVMGQSLLLFGTRSSDEPEFNANTFYSSGGNWNAETSYKNSHNRLLLDQSIFHFHGFDALFNKPTISADFISLELKHRRTGLRTEDSYVEDGSVVANTNDGPLVFKIDYIEKGAPPILPAKTIKAIKKDSMPPYVVNGIQNGKWYSVGIETFIGGEMAIPEHLIPQSTDVTDPNQEVGIIAQQPQSQAHYTAREHVTDYESTFLANLMAIRKDLFTPFNGQGMVRAGQAFQLGQDLTFWGGDTYISDYTFHTYGMWMPGQSPAETYRGTKVARRFICETASNLYARFEIPGNLYSRYYKKSPLTFQDVNNYLTQFMRDQDPNQFGYSKDSNALDDLISPEIFNPFIEDITEHPFRIHRGGKLSRQTKFRSWRTFLPLDYYEMQKNMGKPIHLEGMEDRLLIHCEKALFITQDKTKLESDIIAITLGSGDIFQFEPQEGQSSKLGYAGTQHELACVRTPNGYVFIDSSTGQIFIYKGQLQLINNMLDGFFKEFLRLKETNVFTGNGYTIGYDPTYERILLTVKNRKLINPQQVLEFNPNLIPSLVQGQIIYKNGRLQQFLGLNATEYSCVDELVPDPNDLTVTIPEDTEVGTVIGTVTGTNVNNYYITGNSAPFSLEAATGKVRLQTGGLNFFVKNQYIFPGVAYNSNGNSAPFVITINLTAAQDVPTIDNGEVTIGDSTPSGTNIFNVQARDRENNPLTYSIVGGNTNNTFAINPITGKISVVDQNLLDGAAIPQYILQVNVTNGVGSAVGTVKVLITHDNQPPTTLNYTITINDSTPSGTVVITPDPAVDPEADPLTYALVSESVPGVFSFDPTTLQIKLIDNAQLNPAVVNQYVLNLSASDNLHGPVGFTVTINVIYDLKQIAYTPDQASCAGTGSSCPEGWILSQDGTTCTKITQTAAINNGTVANVCSSSNGAYSNFGAVIYAPGFNSNGTGTMASWLNSAPWNNPTANLVNGALNRCAVWACPSIGKDGQPISIPDNEPIGFVTKFNIPTAKTYYVAVAGDNRCKIVVNGIVVVDQDPTALGTQMTPLVSGQGISAAFKWWHIYPVTIPAGINYIGMEGVNFGGAAGFGAEIYDNTPTELASAALNPAYVADPAGFPAQGNHYSNLNLIFSTRWMRGGTFQSGTTIGWSCQAGYALDTTTDPPSCNLVQSQPAAALTNTKSWAKVKIMDLKRSTQISLLNNDTTPKTFQGLVIPYYAPVNNHIDCGGTDTTFLSVQKTGTAQKSDCATGTGEVVEYVVPAGRYMALSQVTADGQATTDVASNKQPYANLNGKCS